MAALMSLVWVLHLPRKNAGLVDVAWAFGLGLLALFYFSVSRWSLFAAGVPFSTLFFVNGSPEHGTLFVAMALIWSARLTLHLFQRNVLSGAAEDPRYADLRVKWKEGLLFKFYLFFNAQGAMNVFLSLGFLLVMVGPSKGLGFFEWTGFVVWFVALVGEALADWQLKRFKLEPTNKGKVCDTGLWRYSRHPNYFFEWLVWVGYFIFTLGSPWGILSLGAPLLMLFLLLRVTGIPATEVQSLLRKGDVYREYQRRTSPFIPWFPKKEGV